MSNSTFSGPVRSENGFLQQDPETGEWVPISGGGGGGGGTEHLTGDDASTLVQTQDDTYASIPYWNGVDAPAGANPQGRLTLAYVEGYGNNVSYQRMTISEGGQVTANTSPAGAGANGLVYTTVFTTVGGSSTRAEIVLPSDGFLTASSRLAAVYVYTPSASTQSINVYKNVSTAVSSGTLVGGYMQNAIQWDGTASSFLWSLDSNYWNPGDTLQIAPATTWVGVSTLRVAAVFKANS
jgi:archaellum component FlaF (FlaF/FlaG flagellin family)